MVPLIVPYGIEIITIMAKKRVRYFPLIVPYGIEIFVIIIYQPSQCPLIVPYGIEIYKV